MPRKTRRNRVHIKTRKTKGGIRFTNNTKPPHNNDYSGNPLPSYLNELANELYMYIAPSSEYHSNNAHLFATLQETYNDPVDMKKAINLIYNQPHEFTEQERTIIQSLTQGKKIHVAINNVAIAPIPEPFKTRILNFLRHYRMKHRIHKTYEKEHAPMFIHTEWQPGYVSPNQNHSGHGANPNNKR